MTETTTEKVVREAKGKQPKEGNIKITLSVKKETAQQLIQLAGDKRKVGRYIDSLIEETPCKCGAEYITKIRTTKENVCLKCFVRYIKENPTHEVS